MTPFPAQITQNSGFNYNCNITMLCFTFSLWLIFSVLTGWVSPITVKPPSRDCTLRGKKNYVLIVLLLRLGILLLVIHFNVQFIIRTSTVCHISYQIYSFQLNWMKGKVARGYPIEGIRRQQSQTRTLGAPCPTLSEQCMNSFTSCRIVNINKSCETGPI